VEDEDAVRDLLKLSLELYGYKVTVARDGSEGKRIALDPASDGFDIVISDIRMPVCNGRDMVLGIREKLPNLKVVFMSGYSADAFGDEGFQEDPITRFMHKPFSPRHMVGVARQMLDA